MSMRGSGGGCGSHEDVRFVRGGMGAFRGGSGGGLRSAVGGGAARATATGEVGEVEESGSSAGRVGAVGEALLRRCRGWMNSIAPVVGPDARPDVSRCSPDRRCAPEGRRSCASRSSRRSRSCASRESRTSRTSRRALRPAWRPGSRSLRPCSRLRTSRCSRCSLSRSLPRRSSRLTGSTGMLTLLAAFSFRFRSSIADLRVSAPGSPAEKRRLSFSSRNPSR